MTVKVSVLMPIYKTPELYLRTTIESILNQTFKDFEFLILDDGVDDDREAVVKSYKDPRIVYLKNKENMGISGARNKLIDMAKGEYLAVMDHDDISLITRFEEQVAYLDKHPEVGVVGCWADFVVGNLPQRHPRNNKDIRSILLHHSGVLHPTAMIRKSVLIDSHVRYEARYSPAEDYCLWLRLMEYTQFHNVPKVMFRYRNHIHNTTCRQINQMWDVGDELEYMINQKHPEIKPYMKYKFFLGKSRKVIGLDVFKRMSWPKFKRRKTINLDDGKDIVLQKPILVLAHVFYPDLWPQLKSRIQNISPYPFDLYVTMTQELADVQKDIKESFPKVHIEIVENRGYDVGPFVHALNQIDLNNYDYVIKIHTKGDKGIRWRGMNRRQWRLALWSFLKDHQTLTKYLKSFEDPELGMTNNYKVILKKSQDIWTQFECRQRLKKLLFEKKMLIFPSSYVGGTMFICRSSVMRPLQNMHLKLEDFEHMDSHFEFESSFAHVVERLIGYCVEMWGYKCDDCVSPRWKRWSFYGIDYIRARFLPITRFIQRFFYGNTQS